MTTQPDIHDDLAAILASEFCVGALIPGRAPQLSTTGADGILRLANPIQITGRPRTEWVGVDNTSDLPAVTEHIISTTHLATGKPSVRKTGDSGGRRLLLRARPGETEATPFDFPASAAGQGISVIALVKTASLSTATARFFSVGDLENDKHVDFYCDGFANAGDGEWGARYDAVSGNRIPITNVAAGKLNTLSMVGLSLSLTSGNNEIACFLDTVQPGTEADGHSRIEEALGGSDIPATVTDICIHGNLIGEGSAADVAIGPLFVFNVALHASYNATLAASLCQSLCDYAGITPDV